MKFSCDSCGSQYMISDDKVGPNGVKVRCKKCGNVVSVKRPPAAAPEVASASATPGGPGGTPEPSLERDLGQAFESSFGGGSPAIAAERAADPAADLGQDWYVAIDDNQVGPLPATGVKARWESGEIGPDTLAWRPGMADWVPLSTIGAMAQFLAPVPRNEAGRAAAPAAAREPARAAQNTAVSAPATAAPAPAPTPSNGAGWKPSAGSALAALASEELSSLDRPATKPQAESTVKSGSLVDRMQLPDGGVDPTNLLPLPIKGLDQTTEARLPQQRASGAERTEIRQIKRSAMRSVVAIGLAMLVLLGVAVAGILWYLRTQQAPPQVARAPAGEPTPAPAPAPPPAVAQPAPAAAVAPAPAPATAASAPATPSPGPAAAPPPPAAEPPAVAAAPPPPARAEPAPPREPARTSRAKRQREAAAEPPTRTRRQAPQRVAKAEPTPSPAPAEPAPRRRPAGDPLLDVGGDEDIEKELAPRNGKRSVYVPPAIGSDLPESVSQSQIQEAVAGQKDALLRCIQTQKAADPDAKGTLRLRWIITGDGSVRDLRVLSDEFARQPVAPCISGVVKGIRFPRSRTSGQEVVFPFKF